MILPQSALPQKVPRALKMATTLHKILAQVFQELFPSLYLTARVSRVELSPCLKQARLYVASEDVQILNTLKKENWRIRKQLALRARIKFVPKLDFFADKEIIKLYKECE